MSVLPFAIAWAPRKRSPGEPAGGSCVHLDFAAAAPPFSPPPWRLEPWGVDMAPVALAWFRRKWSRESANLLKADVS